ncbi:MAG: transcriptional regulator [Chloroflexi bacterium]|nr:transcriptional regulator [Chloroflexota bacterium]
MSRSLHKAERLLAIEQLLLSHPEGLPRAEIARRLGVHRSTIGRDIEELGNAFPFWENDVGHIGIQRQRYLTHLRLTLHECLAVHLASRLMATQTDKRSPHAASAVRKLAESLKTLAPQISAHIARTADDLDGPRLRNAPRHVQTLELLAEAWARTRSVALEYQSEPDRSTSYTLEPWFVEPYAPGRSTYVIGLLLPPGQPRLLKVERILSARLLDDAPYDVPDDLEPTALFAPAWGAWLGSGTATEVVLRFRPEIAHRVLETQWHHSEHSQVEGDGSLVWCVSVTDWIEMLPWIMGWGGLVEVLAPPDLRARMARESALLAARYAADL